MNLTFRSRICSISRNSREKSRLNLIPRDRYWRKRMPSFRLTLTL